MTILPLLRPQGYVPGLPFAGSGIERYVVQGGGAIVLKLQSGDELEIVDPQGLQRCEVTAFNAQGQEDPKTLGAKSSGPARGLAAVLTSTREDARAVAAGLKARGVQLGEHQAIYLLEGESPPGTSAKFTVQNDGLCVIGGASGSNVSS